MWVMTILNLSSIATTSESIWILLTLTQNIIFQENNALDKDNPETEWSSKFLNNISQGTLDGEGKSHINFENRSFSFFKKTKSKHPKNLFFGHWNVNLIRNKFESVQKIIEIPLTFSHSMKLKLIPPSQTSNLVPRSTEFSKWIVTYMGEDYFFMLIKV